MKPGVSQQELGGRMYRVMPTITEDTQADHLLKRQRLPIQSLVASEHAQPRTARTPLLSVNLATVED